MWQVHEESKQNHIIIGLGTKIWTREENSNKDTKKKEFDSFWQKMENLMAAS